MRLAPPDAHAARARLLQRSLAARQLDALVVTSLPNIAYLTGFFASAAVLIATADALVLIGDGRYASALESRARELPSIHPVLLTPGSSYDQALVDALDPFRGLAVGFEATHMTVRRHRFITEELAVRGWERSLAETDGLVDDLRLRKDAWEITTLRDAAERLSTVAKCILLKALSGRSESDVASEIEAALRRAGFERPAFDTIVAAGPNAALPHARAGSRQIEDGDLVVLDFGGVLDGYCTDLTRTVISASDRSRERRLIEQVVEAQAAAFAAVGPDRPPEAVDEAARTALARHGIAEAFTHGTGHGLGLEIHEAPRLTRARPGHAEPPLAAGMALTLEPGVYFPGWGGVRIEDDVLVTEGGAEWLTEVPRML
jgi:Xaa-Pro aminopeptidase